ncbi:DUF1763-domain-containing protein [Aspergillus transmontanensis]|uniref:DUF1763-domain-containing protein n=1 Tax=Aspergillus transmontanensis TaxID=1034304 RepID=A0A5N6VF35_9EURO|nr:DUF1763-domain-containing protein [Aspergillus transmontanensis]
MSSVAHADQRAVIQAYRHLYRQGLRVINYSTPSRHVLLRTLRSSFRSSSHHDFEPHRIANTLRFLQRATDAAGVEHKIVKNLMMVRYWEQPQVRKDLRLLKGLGIDQRESNLRRDANEQFNLTLMLLNESLGTCLK